MAIQQKIVFSEGGMNVDANPRDIANFRPGDYLHALNVHVANTAGGNRGVVENIRGNVIVEATLPDGDNKVIGVYEDLQDATVVYFIHNSLNNHSIWRYYPATNTLGAVRQVMEDEALNFDASKLITGIEMVDGVLAWTEENNEPRDLDLDKAETWRINEEICVFPNPVTTGATRTVTIQITSNGQLITPVQVVMTATDISGQIDEIVSAWTGQIAQAMTIEKCGPKKFTLTASVTGAHKAEFFYDDQLPGNQLFSSQWKTQHQNIYPGFTKDILDAKAVPHRCGPSYSFSYDSTRKTNLIKNKVFQFMIRYRFHDFKKSVWSMRSPTTIDTASCSGVDNQNNCITIDFQEDRLTDPNWLALITHVEIAFRESLDMGWSSWKLIAQLPQEEWIYTQEYKFYNDILGTVITPTESDKFFDNMPLRAKAMTDMMDESSQAHRRFYGNITSGYDLPCVEAKATLTYDTNDGISGITGEVTARFRVINGLSTSANHAYNQPIHNPGSRHNGTIVGNGDCFGGIGNNGNINLNVGTKHGQWLHAKGFIIYSTGRPIYAVSKQADFTTSNGVSPNLLTDNVYDTSISGFTGNPNNYHHTYAVRAGQDERLVYSEVRLTGLVPGWHIIRVPSHLCSVGDIGGHGTEFDLTNGLKYQETSTKVDQVGTNSGPNVIPGRYECLVYIPATGGTIDIGEIRIVDQASPSNLLGNYSIEGYLRDDSGDPPDTAATTREGIPMEKQEVYFIPYTSALGLLTFTPIGGAIAAALAGSSLIGTYDDGKILTDHNGFFYFAQAQVIPGLSKLKLAAVGITGDTSNPSGSVNPTSTSINATNSSVIKDINDNLYEGGLTGPLTTVTELHTSNETKTYVVYNTKPDLTSNIRTQIKGNVQTASGNGVKDILVMYQSGRWAVTDSNGDYTINAWGDQGVNANNRTTDRLLFNYKGVCQVGLTPELVTPNIAQYDPGASYSANIPLTIQNITAVVIGNGFTITWARDGLYDFGIVYYDSLNRSTSVYWDPGLRVETDPYHTGQAGRPQVTITLSSPVPIPDVGRFTHYAVVVTPNQRYSNFLHWAANDIEYALEYDSAGSAVVPTTFANADAKEVYIDISNLTLYEDEHAGSQLGYTFEDGDMIIFIADENGDRYTTELIYPIQGTRDNKVIIPFENDQPEFKKGVTFKIFTPNPTVDKKLFYEVGKCFTINDPYGTPSHSVTSIDMAGTGDTYYFGREIPVQPSGDPKTYVTDSFESPSISDFWPSRLDQGGRWNAESLEVRQLKQENFIVFSNPYFPDTKLNGLASIEVLNGAPTNKKYGDIMKMAVVNEVLLTICKYNTLSIYVGKVIQRDLQGSLTINLSDRVLGGMRELAEDYGTHNPESFAQNKGNAYWFDVRLGIVVRYSYNGLFPISRYGMWTEFREWCELLYPNYKDQVHVYGVYDRSRDEYILSREMIPAGRAPVRRGNLSYIPYDNGVPAKTWTFWEGKIQGEGNRWICEYSYHPESMVSMGNELITFKDGQLYVHHRNNTYGEFYGVNYPAEITVAGNKGPSKTKVWQAIELMSDGTWSAPEIKTPSYLNRDKTRNEGRLSSLKEEDFELREINLWASFLRDENTPNVDSPRTPLVHGEEMRHRVIIVRLQNNWTSAVVLEEINLYVEGSERSDQ